jgi:ribosome-associated protein YbcJ (S4-like RNA binding protein)
MESNQKSVSPKLLSCSDSGAQAKTHDYKNALYGESIELKLKINNLSETVRALKLRAQARLASTRSPPFKPTAMSMIHLEQI